MKKEVDENNITKEITSRLASTALTLAKNMLGEEKVDMTKFQFHRLTGGVDENVITNIFYGMLLLGSVKIEVSEDFNVSFNVMSKYN